MYTAKASEPNCFFKRRAPSTSMSKNTTFPSAHRRSTSLRNVPYRAPGYTSSHSRKSPAAKAASNSSGLKK